MVVTVALGTSVFVFSGAVVSVLQRFWPTIVWHGPVEKPIIYLTFDDGPDEVYTAQILDILRDRKVRATFFLVGEKVAEHSEVIRHMCAEGHEIANHGTSLRRTIFMSPEDFEADLLQNEEILKPFGCYRKVFRPAGVMIRATQREVLEKHGYECVLGSAYAFDPYRPPARFIGWATRMALRPGSIIVLHDSGGDRSASVAAVPLIIDAARAKGLSFEPLSLLK